MKIKCKNGHIFDPEIYSSCPECNPISHDDELPNTEQYIENDNFEDLDETVPLNAIENEVKTFGWLVCIEGNHFGETFILKYEKNRIGRNSLSSDIKYEINISKDQSISRSKELCIIYYNKIKKKFMLSEGENEATVYINDNNLITPIEIKKYDSIVFKNTKLLFIPFCTSGENWDNKFNSKKGLE